MAFFLSSTNQLTSEAKTNSTTILKEQYIRTLQLIFHPYIQEEVHNRYGDYANVDIFDINIESITIHSPIDITVVVIIKPYTGPHNTISTDKITLHVDSTNIKINNYITVGP
jgi:hypothetical protein